MKSLIQSYLKEEQALDDSVSKILFVVIAIALATAVGYWMWNTVKGRTEKSSCANNPGPFCME